MLLYIRPHPTARCTPAASTADDTHFGRHRATNAAGPGAGETRSGMYDVGWQVKWLVEYMQVPPEGAVPCVGCVLVRVRRAFEALGCSRQATFSFTLRCYLLTDGDSDSQRQPRLRFAPRPRPGRVFFVHRVCVHIISRLHIIQGRNGGDAGGASFTSVFVDTSTTSAKISD